MNRRGFISALLKATAGATVAYSFPSIIVPKNIIEPVTAPLPVFGNFPHGVPLFVDDTGVFRGLARGSINPLDLPFSSENDELLVPSVWLNTKLKSHGGILLPRTSFWMGDNP